MSEVLQLTDGTTTISLADPAGLMARYNTLLTPPPPATVNWARSRLRDGGVPGSRFYDIRQATMGLIVRGASSNAIADTLSALDLMLQRAASFWQGSGVQCFLQWQPDGGATHLTQWAVLGYELDPGAAGVNLRHGAVRALPGGKLNLTVAPWAESTADSTYAALTTVQPFGASLIMAGGYSGTPGSGGGEVPTPAYWLLTTQQALGAGGTGFRVFLSMRQQGTLANFVGIYPVAAGAAGGTTTYTASKVTEISGFSGGNVYTASADALAYGGTAAFWASAAGVAQTRLARLFPFGVPLSDQFGQHRVWGRFRGNVGNAQLYYGAYTTPTLSPGAVTFTPNPAAYTMVDLGLINWPGYRAPSAAPAPGNLYMELASTIGSGGNLYCDALWLAPVDSGAINLEVAGQELFAGESIVLDGRNWPPTVYALTAGGAVRGDLTPFLIPTGAIPQLRPGDNMVTAYMGQLTQDLLSRTMNLYGTWRPRSLWLRGTL